jgi:sporulation protein YlmC with PRC-barrel domain
MRLLGRDIDNPAGEHLGKLEDVVIDLAESHVVVAILSLADPGDVKEPLVAVPLSVLGFDPVQEKVILNVDRKTLKNAPALRTDEWPELIDRAWAANLYAHYDCVPYWD